MKKFAVTVEAVIRKTYTVEAEDHNQASELANQQFSVLPEWDVDEYYDQQTVEIEPEEIPVIYASIGHHKPI